MYEMTLVASVKLTEKNCPTGYTLHCTGRAEPLFPSSLQIVHIGDDPGFYLLYLDDSGVEMTDTYHDSLSRAMDQANLEFRIEPDDWNLK